MKNFRTLLLWFTNYDKHNKDVVDSINGYIQPLKQQYYSKRAADIETALIPPKNGFWANPEARKESVNTLIVEQFCSELFAIIRDNILPKMRFINPADTQIIERTIRPIVASFGESIIKNNQKVRMAIHNLFEKIQAEIQQKTLSEQKERLDFKLETTREKVFSFIFLVIGTILGYFLDYFGK
ncbi:MAG: hypothetical protein HUU02_03945 [Bacteroidetes bacterium]|nr:hypothetical protein [Bacteroidota bacterium]